MKLIIKIFLILLIILITVLAFLGIPVKTNHVWDNIISDYTYGMDFKGFLELRYIVDNSEEEKNVYIDAEGNILGVVREDTNSDVSETETGISLEIPEDAEEEEFTESEETEVLDKEDTAENITPNYARENRVIKANEDSALTKENFEASKKIIQKRIETLSAYEYNIRLDDLTGELIVEAPEDESVGLIEGFVSAVRKI